MRRVPIYEFTCSRCASFELDKKLSVFATQTQAEAPAACGTCGDARGPRACRFD